MPVIRDKQGVEVLKDNRVACKSSYFKRVVLVVVAT